jgi:hypothetical protein
MMKVSAEDEEVDLPAESVVLSVGSVGTVIGLVGAAEYNGMPVKVLEYDGASGRYLVQVAKDKQLKLKRSNVIVSAL